jgi:hypothetical protein
VETGQDFGTNPRDSAFNSPRNTQYGENGKNNKGRKISMAATARSNNLRISQAGGFVFEPHTTKNSTASGALNIWPKNLGQSSIEP